MEINGITVPDVGTTVQNIPDPIGGWLYRVTTDVKVEQLHISEVQDELAEARQQLQATQALIDQLTPLQEAIAKAKPLEISDAAQAEM